MCTVGYLMWRLNFKESGGSVVELKTLAQEDGVGIQLVLACALEQGTSALLGTDY